VEVRYQTANICTLFAFPDQPLLVHHPALVAPIATRGRKAFRVEIEDVAPVVVGSCRA
jgi:hypothetical protein